MPDPCPHPTVRRSGICATCAAERARPAEHVKDARPEADVRRDIRGWYEVHGAQVWDMEQNRPTRQTAGMSDLVVCWPGRGMRFVEVKRKGGRQSDAQRAFQAAVEASGGVYRLVFSVADVEREER